MRAHAASQAAVWPPGADAAAPRGTAAAPALSDCSSLLISSNPLPPGDAFDRKLGAKKFDMGGSSEDGGSSDGEGESSEEDEDEDDEGEEGLPDLDSDDMIAEATDSGESYES